MMHVDMDILYDPCISLIIMKVPLIVGVVYVKNPNNWSNCYKTMNGFGKNVCKQENCVKNLVEI